jgi:hypothetical protein
VAGRMRQGLNDAKPDEVEFRDGVHGLAVWALATVLTALVALSAAQGLASLARPSTNSSESTSSPAGESLFAYELDRLFRSGRPMPTAEIAYNREEAARILLTAGRREGISPADREYLAQLVANRTGIAEADAQQRTQDVIARAGESLRRARHSTTVLAFFAGAAAMVGAAAAWFAARVGGEQRDNSTIPSLQRARRNRSPTTATR